MIKILRYIWIKVLVFFAVKKNEARSDKAQEKLADQFMNVSTSTFTAVIVGFLVIPLTEMIKASIGIDLCGNANLFNYISFAERLYSHPSEVLFFLLIYFAALLFSAWSRKMALELYDRLDKKPINKP